jgi:putative transcriptional regulator
MLKKPIHKGTAPKRAKSSAFASIHSLAAGLHSVGAIDQQTMRGFDASCLEPVPKFSPSAIIKIRRSTKMSQPLFAARIGMTKSTVQKWESGAKSPTGAAAKLLSIVKKHGVAVLD